MLNLQTKMAATSQTDKASDEIINIKCCLCFEDNRIREAEKYCVDCKNYYCTPCTGMHKKFPSMKEHKLLDKEDFRSLGPDGSLPSFPTQRCSEHHSEVVNLYCADHDEVACASCIALKHRTCTDIHSIPEEVDDLYNTTELNNMKQKIQKTMSILKEVKTSKEDRVKEVKKAFDKEVKSVKSFRQELQKLLDDMEQETIMEIKKEFDRIEECLISEINEVNKLIDSINDVSSQLKKSIGNKAQEFVSIKYSEKMTAKAEDMRVEQHRKTEETVSFMADQNIKTVIEKCKVLGKVFSSIQTIPLQRDGLYKVKHHKEIDVQLVSDKSSNCSIWCSCFTYDGCVLLADLSNQKLKRLDMSTEKIKDFIKLPSYPRAVCMISRTEAAVSLDNDSLQFVSLSNKLTATHRLTMEHSCYGLAHNSGKLFIAYCGPILYIHDMNGKHLQTISTDAFGKNIFQNIQHIKVSSTGDRILVADCKNGLVILDSHGKYITTLTDPSIKSAADMCTDGKNLFVCGRASGNIVQIGPDYKVLGELWKVTGPLSVCFDPDMTRLLVTSRFNNKITVLELE